jgi:hypothetical protein
VSRDGLAAGPERPLVGGWERSRLVHVGGIPFRNPADVNKTITA